MVKKNNSKARAKPKKNKSKDQVVIVKEFINTPFKEVKNSIIDSLEEGRATTTPVSSMRGVALENEVNTSKSSTPRIIGDGRSSTAPPKLDNLGRAEPNSDDTPKINNASQGYSPKTNDLYVSSGDNRSPNRQGRTSSVAVQGTNVEIINPRRIVNQEPIGGFQQGGSSLRRIDVSGWADQNTTMGMSSGSQSNGPQYSGSNDYYLKKIGEKDDEEDDPMRRRT